MELFGGVYSITGVIFFLATLFVIAFVGYLIGGIKIKGVSLGTSGVFLISLIFGMFLYDDVVKSYESAEAGYKVVQNIGLLLFITSVGFIAGPNFFSGLKKNATSYVLLGFIIILTAGLVTGGILFVDKNLNSAMATGLLAGALTSTPAYSSAIDSLPKEFQAACSAGYGIAYIFGVVGVVLFVQLMPKLLKVDMPKEIENLKVIGIDNKERRKDFLQIDDYGIFAFAFAVVLGLIVGAIKIPLGKGSFSLGTTGGPLLVALVMGHFYNIKRVKIMPDMKLLKVFREFGLMLFLIGAGVPGGAKFLQHLDAIYFLYGALITILPMVVGFVFAKFVLKLPLLNNLGSITGGMTSTPALGTLISVAETDDVANAYAATYPIALVSVVVLSQLLILIFPVA